MKKIIFSWVVIVFMLFVFNFISAQNINTNDVIEIAVDSTAIKEMLSWPEEIAFFTSASNPINNLKDVLSEEGLQIGFQNPYVFELLGKLTQLFELDGVKIREEYIDSNGVSRKKMKVTTLGLGNAYFSELFTNRPRLRLFVALLQNAEDEKIIVESGKGVRVKFKAR